MKDWIDNGYPDYLPINTIYPPANGEKNGIKKQLEDAADEKRRAVPGLRHRQLVTGYFVIGWAAFVIDGVVKWTARTASSPATS